MSEVAQQQVTQQEGRPVEQASAAPTVAAPVPVAAEASRPETLQAAAPLAHAEQLREVPRPPAPPRATRAVAEDEDETPPRRSAPARGRPPAGTERTRRTVKENWAKARTDEARAKALAAAVRAELLHELPLTALQWGREAGVLSERQYMLAVGVYPEAPKQEAAQAVQAPVQPAPAPVSPPAQPAAGIPQPASAAPAQQPAAPPPPPPVPLYMGQPVERVEMFAKLAYTGLKFVSEKLPASIINPTAHVKGTLFRGLPFETKVDAVPLERMAELAGVIAAEKWPARPGDAGVGSAKTELAVLGFAAFGPALMAMGQHVGGALLKLGRGIGGRLRSRFNTAGEELGEAAE